MLAAWSLALIAWLTLHWGILPRLDQWRPRIEAVASQAVGVPVRIGRLEVRSAGWVPTVEVHDVRLLDAQGRDALRLARVVAALAPSSMLVLEPRFAQLLVENVELDVRRLRDGSLQVAGLGLQPAAAAAGDGGSPLAACTRGRRTGTRRYELRLAATPPADWGQRLTLRARMHEALLARGTRWQRWSGEAYASLPVADLSQLRRHVELPFELREGRGAVRAWVRIDRGLPVQTTADLALGEVSMRLASALPELGLRRLEGRIEWRDDARRLSLSTERLGFETDDGVSWAPSSLRLALDRPAAGQPFSGGTMSADRLDLATMARIAARLPLGATLHDALEELRPQGTVESLVAQWHGPL